MVKLTIIHHEEQGTVGMYKYVMTARVTYPCASCMYGKMTKKPWRYKKENCHIQNEVQDVGGCVLVDQLESHSFQCACFVLTFLARKVK
jgi:hypothetical protein